jgi:hypothetical protein
MNRLVRLRWGDTRLRKGKDFWTNDWCGCKPLVWRSYLTTKVRPRLVKWARRRDGGIGPRRLPQVSRNCRWNDMTGRPMPSMRPASRLAVRWLTQLRSLRRALVREPSSHEAWHWRIRIKVLSFLVSRYGDDPAIESRLGAGHPPISLIVPKDSAYKEHPPRSAAELRELLHQIADAKRPEPPSTPSHP